ncbi:lipid A deacylase LpxR family protein [Sulfurimonas paralvinellae]|uniref:Lipid A deacylase LpxR family protein n=1 Tax=Sulfurimonas paralvinellae TaxID=317658 RepID=A0A7M1B821_9BACT|nr:lipid A deacylase LpxR family protein [Sulfurimonas paralvinellae]QOP45815.1 lipid A deacylase LpxR family protein [Sulfurimonas paralvinellae]
MKRQVMSLFLLSTISLNADQIAFAVDNDFFVGKDGHFTNGATFAWLEDNEQNGYTDFLIDTLHKFSIELDKSKNYNAGVSLTQIIITPDDTTIVTPQYNDIPYAGYLALSTYLIQSDSNSFIEYAFDLGIVGPASLAESTQDTFHAIIGNDKPAGWNTQLGTQLTANLLVNCGEISWEGKLGDDLDADWFNNAAVSLGNFNTSVLVGTAFRVGRNYVRNFNEHYPCLREEPTLVGVKNHKGFGYSFDTGISGVGVAYNYILNEAKDEGYQTEKENFKMTGFIAADVYYDNHKLSFYYQGQTPAIKEDNSNNYFGGFLYSYKF